MTTIFPGRFQQVHTNAYSGAFMNSPALQGAFASLQKQYPDCNDQIIQAMAMEQYGMSPEIIAKNAYDTAMKEVLKELEKEINIEDRKLDVEQKKIEDEAKMLEKQAEALDQAIDKGIDKNAPKYC